MEGWVRVRVAGQTDWKRMWMVVSGGDNTLEESPSRTDGAKKKRISLFGRDPSPPRSSSMKPTISMFTSPKPKDKKKAFLSMCQLTQAFAVYPERPELISRSNLMKLEGQMGDEHAAGGMRGREGWWLVIPDVESGNNQASELLKWVVGQYVFFLYLCRC